MLPVENQPTKILIVDDDPVSRILMEEILKTEGYSISWLTDGDELLQRLPEIQPHILLLDVLMPGSNGFDLCRQIKADPRWQHLPIVLVTSLNTDQELETGLDAGADEFISKPVSATELRARVRSMRRVKQRYDLLLRIAQMREDLAQMVVHDLRTPLSVSMMRTDILLKMIDQEKIQVTHTLSNGSKFSLKDSLLGIKNQMEKLNLQVDEILLLAKTDQDELVLDREVKDLCEIVRAAAADYRTMAERDQVGLEIQLPDTPCQYAVDVNLFTRLIGNLLGNALKFSPRNGRIEVRLLPGEKDGSWILEVADVGPGVDEADRERIFDRYAVASSAEKNLRSIGLGLAFCKMVAEAHGGTISVHDNEPQGSLFRVTLQ